MVVVQAIYNEEVHVLNYTRETKRKIPQWVGVAALALILGFYGYDYWKRNKPPAGPFRSRIMAVDADTGAPLNPTVGYPPVGRSDPWQIQSVTMTKATEVRWMYRDKPCPITVGANGYQSVEILLTPSSPLVVTVRLKRQGVQ